MEAKITELTTLFAQFTSTSSEEIKQLRAQVDAFRDENAKLKARVEQLEKCTIVSPVSEKVVEKFRTVERAIEEFVMTAPLEIFNEQDKEKIDRAHDLQWLITWLRTEPNQYWEFLDEYNDGKFIVDRTILDSSFVPEYINEEDPEHSCWHIPEWDKIAAKYGLETWAWRR